MDHKKFLQELQKRSGLDRNRLQELLKATENVIQEQAVNLNSVSLDGLGTFEPRKRLEFIHENRETGEQILYPPRIVIHFTPALKLSQTPRKGGDHE